MRDRARPRSGRRGGGTTRRARCRPARTAAARVGSTPPWKRVDVGVDLDPVAGGEHRRPRRRARRARRRAAASTRPSPSRRERSSSATGAAAVGHAHDEHAHARPPPGGLRIVEHVDSSLALLVEGQDLQLDGQVDLADVDAVGHREHGRREVQDAASRRRPTSRSQTSWAAAAGVAMTPIATPCSRDDLLEVVERPDRQPGDLLARARGVGVDQRRRRGSRASGSRRSWPARARGCRCRR